ncbi:MAG: Rrf2 family transcriptional regulator [Phycisphaeraceae bacterium]
MSLRFTRKADYSLVALAALAQGKTGANRPLSAQDIAQRQGLPRSVLMNLLKRLHQAGIIVSRRGAAGGYWLARPADQITIADVIEAIDGPINMAPCCDEEPDAPGSDPLCVACRIQRLCPISESMHQVNTAIVDLLRSVSIADLLAGRPLSLAQARPCESSPEVSLAEIAGATAAHSAGLRRAAPTRPRNITLQISGAAP